MATWLSLPPAAAELAFGVGCTLGVLAIVLLLVIVYFAITKIWTIVIVTGLLAVLIERDYLSHAGDESQKRHCGKDIPADN